MNETCIGIFNIVFNAVMMVFYMKFMEGVAGLKAAMISIAVLSFVLTAIAMIVLDNPKEKIAAERAKKAAEAKEKAAKKTNVVADFLMIMKQPATWLVAISIFAVYSFLTTLTYFTPYFTDVLGVAVTFSGGVAILRQHGMTLLGAPIGGILTDKVGSPSKVLLGVYTIGILSAGCGCRCSSAAADCADIDHVRSSIHRARGLLRYHYRSRRI